MKYTGTVEKWGVFELSCPGRTEGNPFTDNRITATFKSAHEQKTVEGFYDGEGVYRVRFMPSYEEAYRFTVSGNFSEESYSGSFSVTGPTEGNHGPVQVHNTFHFAYADGTAYYPIGTTCYVWELQSDELIAQTIESLRNSPFNKIRFCVFPKSYCYNAREPRSYPYEGTPVSASLVDEDNVWDFGPDSEGNRWDFSHFNPAHFRHIEDCIRRLQEIGIEADIILFHPYDRWLFDDDGGAKRTVPAVCCGAIFGVPQRLVVLCERIRFYQEQNDRGLGEVRPDPSRMRSVSSSALDPQWDPVL